MTLKRLTLSFEEGRDIIIDTDKLLEGSITLSRESPEVVPYDLDFPLPIPHCNIVTINFSFSISNRGKQQYILQNGHLIGEVINQESEE